MNSKDPKYIQNDPVWAQNGPKWAQRSIPINEVKEPKWPQMSLNELKFLKKYVSVMHISVRHEIFYNFSSSVINV